MTTIKLELPESNATVLYHFGEALRNIAVHEGFVAPSNNRKTTISETIGDRNYTVTDEPIVVAENITPPEAEFTEAEAIAHIGNADDNPMDIVEPANETVKLPWDQRIHSRGKTQLADGTWRYARKPNDKTKEEWDLYVKEVEAELVALMAIPVVEVDNVVTEMECLYWSHDESDSFGEVVNRALLDAMLKSDPLCHEITKGEYDDLIERHSAVTPEIATPEIATPEIVTPEIVTPEIVTPEIATPEIVTPEIVTPEIVTTPEPVATGPQNFGELMRFITANGKKLNNDIVKEVLAANGLASIALLAARVDLIPQIHQALLGKL